MSLADILRHSEALRKACEADPGMWNLLRAEQEWMLYGDACDPLSPRAPERALKALQRDIYLEIWGAGLAEVGAGARALAAGGGTGRFAQLLVERGFRVELIDASPEAVQRAARHLGSSVSVTLGDITQPDRLERAAYDLILAVEVACYATLPANLMRQLRTALRPGGTLLFSVEARPGALLADGDLSSPEAVLAVLDEGVITLPGLKHVHYYTRQEAVDLAQRAGLSVLNVEGACYVPDGPFGRLVDATRLHEPSHLEQLKTIERRCRSHPLLRELPRAWAVTAVAG